MSCKSLLALSLVGALVLFLTGSVSAQAAAEPASEQLKTHTVTIYNGRATLQRSIRRRSAGRATLRRRPRR